MITVANKETGSFQPRKSFGTYGPIVVTEAIDGDHFKGRYALTHAPTGRLVDPFAFFDKLAKARACARALATSKDIDWPAIGDTTRRIGAFDPHPVSDATRRSYEAIVAIVLQHTETES